MVKARNLRLGMMAAMGGLALLAGCGSSDRGNALLDAKAPCPRISIIADAADLTRFRPGGGRDLTAMELNASVSGFQAKCDYGRNGGLDVTITPSFLVERGPAFRGNAAQITYMVAIMQDDQPVAPPTTYGLQVEFAPNVSRAQGSDEINIRLPGNAQAAARRQVWLGFVLSQDELALNRARGPR
ncbi:hypothetical protein BKE38_06200 [Pseudoroseomonas deserti]|uniref:Uncharacterized protein n=1 Tax=Teichococcus deserti TaxID=1817963 RepID=A0A1V2H597_9PROT|nr:hypothetical protein [Pseudoroseomonas deserti]ONG56308.1 hypothetical protein BKE38_06200 [Pseudoroseomonas deserti]